MSLSTQAESNVTAVESRLAELDEVFQRFCSREGYRFTRLVGVWPRRRVWRRDDIDRCLDLTMDVGVQEVLDRGFYPELRWSLHATGSLNSGTDAEVRFLARPVFEHLPLSTVVSILTDSLERGAAALEAMTRESILAEGRPLREDAEPGASPNGGPAEPSDNSGVAEGPPSVS